jgi:integrase
MRGRWQVFAKVKGRVVAKSYSLDTALDVLKAKRRDLIARATLGPEPSPDLGDCDLFPDEAEHYLTLVGGMPSFADRAYEIRQWSAAFETRSRATIKSKDIRQVLETWRVSGRADGGPLAPGSLNRRRTALMHLYTTLDGKSAANPVKDVPVYDESAAEQIRAQPPMALARIIGRVQALKWKTRRPAHQGTRRAPSKTKARLWLMLCTGWPPAQIMTLQPTDLDAAHERVWVAGRKKGKGSKGRWLPLVPGAIQAVRRFFAAKATGRFSTSGMHKAFQRALAAENRWRQQHGQPRLPHMSPYACRHTFGTELAKVVKDERVIQEMLLLTNPQQVRRYTEAATASRLEQARADLRRRFGAKVRQQVARGLRGRGTARKRA